MCFHCGLHLCSLSSFRELRLLPEPRGTRCSTHRPFADCTDGPAHHDIFACSLVSPAGIRWATVSLPRFSRCPAFCRSGIMTTCTRWLRRPSVSLGPARMAAHGSALKRQSGNRRTGISPTKQVTFRVFTCALAEGPNPNADQDTEVKDEKDQLSVHFERCSSSRDQFREIHKNPIV